MRGGMQTEGHRRINSLSSMLYHSSRTRGPASEKYGFDVGPGSLKLQFIQIHSLN